MTTINQITAQKSGGSFEVKIYMGTGSLDDTVHEATHEENNHRVDWDTSSLPSDQRHMASFTTNFPQYLEDKIAGIFINGNREGGVIIKQTKFPPKANNEKKGQGIVYENDAESNDFELVFFDVKETSPGNWSLKITLNPTGGADYALDSADIVSFLYDGDNYDVLQLKVSTDPLHIPAPSSNPISVNVSNFPFPFGVSIPIVITENDMLDDHIYHKKGMFQIND